MVVGKASPETLIVHVLMHKVSRDSDYKSRALGLS